MNTVLNHQLNEAIGGHNVHNSNESVRVLLGRCVKCIWQPRKFVRKWLKSEIKAHIYQVSADILPLYKHTTLKYQKLNSRILPLFH